MKAHPAQQSADAIEPQEVQQALGSIFKGKHFINAYKKQKFLQLICDYYLQGRVQDLNEHLLAYDVFDRDNNYNPSEDPIVRVFAHDIRKKLEAYYATEGAHDTIRLEIPAGSYQPVFIRQSPESTVEVADAASPAQSQNEVATARRYLTVEKVIAGIIIVCLTIAVIVLTLSNHHLKQEINQRESANPTAYGTMWTSFLEDSNPPLVILSNPPILRFINPSDPEEVTKDSILLTPEIAAILKNKFVTNPEVSIKEGGSSVENTTQTLKGKEVIEQTQTPRLILSRDVYTGVGEAIGLHYLTDFFRNANRHILLKQSRTLSAEDLKNRNVIMLGGVWVNEWSGKLTRSEDFVFTNKGTIENRNPQPGEERQYIPQFERRTGNLTTDYALITVKPNILDSNDVMMLAGVYSQGTEAAAEYITSKSYLEQFNKRLQQAGKPPRYFQALLKVGVENGIPTTVSILALHEITPL